MTPALLVGADDRTGALETAAAIAERGRGPVLVLPLVAGRDRRAVGALPTVPAEPAMGVDGGVVVVDLASRHALPGEAARRAASLDGADPSSSWRLHKIDSTLRGNWAAEVVARSAGRRVVVIPALPALGRTCVAGTVRERGVPVAEGPAGRDPVAPIRSSRPADHLIAAGAVAVGHARDAAELSSVLADPAGGIVVCDARDDRAVLALVDVLTDAEEMLVAGTSAVLASLVERFPGVLRPGPAPARAPVSGAPDVPIAGHRPVVVVCGSQHPGARRQVDALVTAGVRRVVADPAVRNGDRIMDATPVVRRAAASGVDGHVVVTVPLLDGAERGAAASSPDEVAATLAGVAGRVVAEVAPVAVVLIGGDTAAAVLGDVPVAVHGTLGTGTSWGRRLDDGLLVVTRAGGFGRPDDLIGLVDRVLALAATVSGHDAGATLGR